MIRNVVSFDKLSSETQACELHLESPNRFVRVFTVLKALLRPRNDQCNDCKVRRESRVGNPPLVHKAIYGPMFQLSKWTHAQPACLKASGRCISWTLKVEQAHGESALFTQSTEPAFSKQSTSSDDSSVVDHGFFAH